MNTYMENYTTLLTTNVKNVFLDNAGILRSSFSAIST